MFGYLFLLFTVAFVFSPAVGDSVQVHSKQITLRANISSKELLSQLFRKLKAAYEKGLNSLQQILDDPDVKDILEHLGPLSKRVAQAIINKFKELAKVIDEATKETQVQTFQAGEDCSKLLEQLKENMMEFLEFGMESVYEFLSSPEVQNIIVRFHSLYPDVVEEIIDRFIELVEAMEQMKEDKTEAYGFVGESASAMIKKIIQRLFSVYRQGTAAIEAVLNDHDVKEILDSLDSVSRRIAEATIKKIKEMAQDFTEESNTTAKRDLGEKTKSSLKLLVEVLQKAFTKGKSYFYKVLEDPDVKGIIDHLGPLSRRAAEVIIENFKYLLEKIDNSIGDDTIQQDSIQTYGLLDESVNLLKTMVQTLKAAYVKGADYLDQIITNPDFQHVLGHMNSLTRRAAEALINGFRALAMKIDEVTHISDEDSRVGNVLRNLLDKLSNAYNKGTEELNKVLNDEAVQKILQSLDSVSRRIADAVIAKLKEMAIILDEATKDANGLELPERFKEHMKKLTHILISAYRKGSAEFEKVLHDRDVKQLLEGLDSVTRKIADTFIEKLRQMVKNVDEATKEKRSVDEESFGVRERSADVIKKMIQKLMAVYKQGYEAVEKVLNDPDVKDILESMDSLSRRVVESIINKFKELAKKVDEATQEKRELEEESYVLREKATEIVKQLVQRLMAAYRRGYEDLEKVLNDDDVKAIIEGLDSISRRIVNVVIDRLREMVKNVDEATKEKRSVDEESFGVRERSADVIKKMIQKLMAVYKQGYEAVEKVLNDPDVKDILESMDSLSRRVVESIINKFKELAKKVDEATQEKRELEEESYVLREKATEIVKQLVQRLMAAYRRGYEDLEKVLNDDDVKAIIEGLDSISRRIVNVVIDRLREMVKNVDEATKEKRSVDEESFGVRERSADVIKKMIQKLMAVYKQGYEAVEKVLNDPDVKDILESMDSLSRRVVESIINKFKELAKKVDEATQEKRELEEESYVLREKATEIVKQLVQRLMAAYRRGYEDLEKVLNDDDVKAIIEGLDSISRRIVNVVIDRLREMVKNVDEATKEKRSVDEESFGVRERSADVIKKMIQKLMAVYKQGYEAVEKVLNDPDVKDILESMDSLSRRVVESIINKFKELAKKVDEATQEKRELEEESYVLREKATEIVKQLVQRLMAAYRRGYEDLEKVLNDDDVKAIIEGLDSISRRIVNVVIDRLREMVKNVDEATKEKRSVDEESFGVRERSADVIKKMIQKLMAVYKQGYEAVEKVLNDPDVKDILESMDSLSRRVVESIINKFKELAKKVDEATQEKRELEEESYVLREKATEIVKQLVQRLMAAYRRGYEDLEKVLNDDDVKAIIEGLDSISRRIVNAVIDRLREMAQPDTMKRGLKEDSKQSLKYLISILQKAFSKGKRYFYEVLEDKDVKNIIEHLGPLSRRIANSIIDNFKSLLEKINNSLEDEKEADTLQQLSIRNDGIELMKKIVRTLKSAYVKGEEYLNKVLDDLDFKKVLNRLNSINRRIVQNIIYEFQQLAKRIDEATKE